MEGLKLSEQELQHYGELFQACDVEGTGKISILKAAELFRASGLNSETLLQVTERCGAKRLGHFGRSQFYIALKLIAGAQMGLPPKVDTLNSDFPLPKFNKANDHGSDKMRSLSAGDQDSAIDSSKPSLAGQLPPPPSKKHARSLSGQYRGIVSDSGQQFPAAPIQTQAREDSPPGGKSPPFNPAPEESPPMSPVVDTRGRHLPKQQTLPASFGASGASGGSNFSGPGLDSGHSNPLALASPPGLNAAATSAENGSSWAMFEDDESHMLLGSGIKKYDHLEPPGVDSSSISSEAESVDDVWTMSEELREYYVKQFLTLQPDLGGVITGAAAKTFFEKSKLPVSDLSKIWQLSDLNRDGALNLDEFCIAMHLVVLKRNDIDLPDRLPLSLMPYATLTNDEPFAADLPKGSTLKRATPPSSPQASQWTATFAGQESPSSSGVPSPALKPVNFEFHKPIAADPDAKIIHPVPLRMSPGHPEALGEGYSVPEGLERDPVHGAQQHEAGGEAGETAATSGKPRSLTESLPDPSPADGPAACKYSTPLHGRPRPVPKKPHPVPAVVRGQLQPPPAPATLPLLENDSPPPDIPEPSVPPPPPRPPHSRSLSVDLKSRTDSGQTTNLMPPPAVPPRVSPKDVTKPPPPVPLERQQSADRTVTFAEPTSPPSSKPEMPSHLMAAEGSTDSTLTLSSGPVPPLVSFDQKEAGVVEPPTNEESEGAKEKAVPTRLALRQASRDKRELQMALRTHKERNSMLTRLNSELNQELQEVMEQRIALEIQLEHLRPFSS